MNLKLLSDIVTATLANSFLFAATDEANVLAQAGYVQLNADVPNTPEGQIAARATDAGIQFSQSQGNATAETSAFGGFGGAPVNTGTETGSHAINPAGGVPQSQGTANAGAGATQTGVAPVFIAANNFQPVAKQPGEGVKREQPEKYPFGELKAPTQTGVDASGKPTFSYEGAAIFVPSTKHGAKSPKAGQVRTGEEMAFSLQSACSAANRRYATVKGERTGADGKVRKEYDYSREFRTQAGTGPNGEPGAYIYRAK